MTIFLKKLRIDHGETLKNMAEKIGVTSSFLSLVETGKRRLPDELCEKIVEQYELPPEQQKELYQAALASGQVIKINLSGVSQPKRKLAASFAIRFSDLSEREVGELQEILDGHPEQEP
ncbi:MAG: helix-turn-helix transcriptional regulator [Lachnospiraceae bacterium]|nr:helix-turn-helix transcriptional regulator [Lachnospiraceae bacterium]